MTAPMWTVSRPIRVWRIRPGEWALVLPGEQLLALDWQGGNRVAVHLREWVIVPPAALDALVLVPPRKESA
jgi:hypothetical protein